MGSPRGGGPHGEPGPARGGPSLRLSSESPREHLSPLCPLLALRPTPLSLHNRDLPRCRYRKVMKGKHRQGSVYPGFSRAVLSDYLIEGGRGGGVMRVSGTLLWNNAEN